MVASIRLFDPTTEIQMLVAFLASVSREPSSEEAVRATLTADVQLRRLTVIPGADKALIGYCSVTRLHSAPPGQATVWIATHPQHRQRGIATTLYRDTCAFLQTHQIHELRTRIEDDDHASFAFARRRGFTVDRHLFRSTLNLQTFDSTPFQSAVQHAQAHNIIFATLAELGDTPQNRRQVYELNKVTAADIPGRGPFFSFEEYQQSRFEHPSYRAAGVFLAIYDQQWVGLKQVSIHSKEGCAFDEMTGILREYRGQQIAQALKVYAISYAQSQQLPILRTFNDSANLPMLAINRKLGYHPEAGVYFMSAELEKNAE